MIFGHRKLTLKVKFWHFLPLMRNSKFNNLLWVCWFLGNFFSNFVSPLWNRHNPYCHNLDNYSQIIAPRKYSPNLYIQFIFQFVILLPIYVLHFCDGASSCIPAIILQHFKEDCSIVRINLSLGEESFIGMLRSYQFLQGHETKLLLRLCYAS